MVLKSTRFSCPKGMYYPKLGTIRLLGKNILALVTFILVGYLLYQTYSSSRYSSLLREILSNNDDKNDALCKRKYGLEMFYIRQSNACDYCKAICDDKIETADPVLCFSQCKEYLILEKIQNKIANLRDEIIKEIQGINSHGSSDADNNLSKKNVELELKIDKAIDDTNNLWKEVEVIGKNSIVEMKNLRGELEEVKKKIISQRKMTQDAVTGIQASKILFYFASVYFTLFITVLVIFLFFDNCWSKLFGRQVMKKVRQI